MGNKKDGQAPVDATLSETHSASTKGLTPKQKAFIREFLKHSNASKAARDAGLGETRHDQLGHQMLRNAEVQAELARKFKKQEDENDLSKSWVLKQLKNMVTYDPAKHFEMVDGTIALKSATDGSFPKGLAKHVDLSTGMGESNSSEGNSVSKSFSFRGKDRIRALELIAKLMGYMDARTGAFDPASREAHQQRVSDAIRRRTG